MVKGRSQPTVAGGKLMELVSAVDGECGGW